MSLPPSQEREPAERTFQSCSPPHTVPYHACPIPITTMSSYHQPHTFSHPKSPLPCPVKPEPYLVSTDRHR